MNLSCNSPYAIAFYHRILDCFAVEYLSLKHVLEETDVADLCVVGYLNRAEFYISLSVLPRSSDIFANSNTIKNGALMAWFPERKIVGITPTSISENVAAIARDVQLGYREPTSGCGDIILVCRRGVRNWESQSAVRLWRSLYEYTTTSTSTNQYNMKVVIYNGTEDVNTTIGIFYRAAAVVMYHGAAAANMLFTRKSTIMIEWTTYVNSTHIWRSNVPHLLRLRGDIESHVHALPLSTAFPNVNVTELTARRDGDRWMKTMRDVKLTDTDIHNMKKDLDASLPKLCSQRMPIY